MGTCCSTDSRLANADATSDELNVMGLKPIQSPKDRQVHSGTPDINIPQSIQNPEIQAQEIELLHQQPDPKKRHISRAKTHKVRGSQNEHHAKERHRDNDQSHNDSRGHKSTGSHGGRGGHGSRGGRGGHKGRENDRQHQKERGQNSRNHEKVQGDREEIYREDYNRPVLNEIEYAVPEQNVVEYPAPEDGHHDVQLAVEEVMREEEYGVTYYINSNTQELIRIHVAASEAKGNIQEIQDKITSQNENLRSISISFNEEETENMDYFITELLKTSTYTSINIVFANLSTFSEQALQEFSDIIANNPLEKFYITHASHDATDSFFATVMPAVHSCKETLKELSIQSGNCQELSDDAIRHVANAIEWNQALEYVALHFGNTTHLTDNAISELRSAFNLKDHLKKLELGFENLPQLTDEALVSFCEIVENLHNLADVSIITPEAGFSPEKYQEFEYMIRNYNLQNVNLYWKD